MVKEPVIIIGGGVAGLSVAKTLIDSGIDCTIIEKGVGLGGHAHDWACMATDQCQRCFCCVAEDLVRGICTSERAQVLTGRQVSSILNADGNGIELLVREDSTGTEVRAAATALVLATGFEPYNPVEKTLWGYKRLEGVYTLAEVDTLLREDLLSRFTRGDNGLSVAFFQCVGSRDPSSGANYCSQYCCKAALRLALKMIHECPRTEVTVFYIDLQLAGKYSGELLRNAEQNKVRLRQGVPGEVTEGPEGLLDVIVQQDGRNVKQSFDRIVLSVGQRPAHALSSLSGQLGLTVNDFGFIDPLGVMENSRTAVPRVYVAGTCSGPKDIEQTLENAGQTAAAIIEDFRREGLL
ncbi:MAG: CoB--CoM heterodisulfide reductase iron-sulfur subunit A family protein [Desulfomonile tiedjei]|nr:CoB--CoM heterodisulfide reductase iron-sulfur subunit A family protein [Desulfomonile tiedjei]